MPDERQTRDHLPSGEQTQPSSDHTRTVTDLVDEIRRDAFTKMLAKRLAKRHPAYPQD